MLARFLGSFSAVLFWTLLVSSKADEDRLSMLVLVPFTGSFPRKGVGCKAAVDIAIDQVNARADILPGYRLEADYRDEGRSSKLSAKQAVLFKRDFDSFSKKNGTTVYPAPAMVGPFYSSGCQSLSHFVHYLNLVQAAVGCGSPLFTENRKTYPNMYRTHESGELVAFPKLQFIKEIGEWQKIGILTFAGNLFDYTVALFLLEEALKQNITVGYFDFIYEVNEHVVLAMKRSDVRIISVEMIVPPLTYRFLCLAHKLGIRGSRYFFILHPAAYINPRTMPKVMFGCPRSVIIEQFKITIFMAGPNLAKHSLTSTIGHNQTTFLRLFDEYTNYSKPADTAMRTHCYDAALQGILSLDEAEKRLKTANLTLRDYINQPERIMQVVNKSMSQLDFVGIRFGQIKLTPRLELDFAPMAVLQWTESEGLKMLYLYRLKSNHSPYSYKSYEQEAISSVIWTTGTGKPPRDTAVVNYVIDDVPETVSWFVIGVATCLVFLQSFMFAKYQQRRKSSNTLPFRQFPMPMTFLFIGSIFFNMGASFSLVKSVIFPEQMHMTKVSFITLGLSLVGGMTFGRVFIFKHMSQKATSAIAAASSTSKSSTRAKSRGQFQKTMLSNAPKKAEAPVEITVETGHVRLLTGIILTGTLLTAVILTVWFLLDPVHCRLENISNGEMYLEASDTYLSIDAMACTSGYEPMWTMTITGANCLAAVCSALLIFQLRQLPQLKASREFKIVGALTAAMSSLLFSVILLAITIQIQWQLNIAISVVALVASFLVSLAMFLPGLTD